MSDTPESDGFFFKRGSWSDDTLAFCRKLERERDEAREQIRELIYIAERAIALAEIDFENDKFGVVTELREALMSVKMSTSK
jgi:hypothetical protein